MKKTLFIFTTILFFALALASCKKDEVKNNDNNNGNTENPGGGGSEGGWHVYPSTAHVLPNAVTDIDGNSYDAVQIGNQVWMAENLRTTRFADGTAIPMGSNSTYSSTEPYRYAPGSNQSNEENMVNVSRYGYLYNWPAVMHGANSSYVNPSGVQGICPTGWHVPSETEWKGLLNYMKTQPSYMANSNADHLAKALAATWGWISSDESDATDTDVPGNNPSTNNATGFSALPAGFFPGSFTFSPPSNTYYNGGFGFQACFWSATQTNSEGAIMFDLRYDHANVRWDESGRGNACSVRCVRD